MPLMQSFLDADRVKDPLALRDRRNRRMIQIVKSVSRDQEALLTTGVGWAAVSVGPLQDRRSRLAQMIPPKMIR